MCYSLSKTIFVIFWCAFCAAGFFLYYFFRGRRHFALLQEQAIKRGGKVVRHAWIFPELVFSWENYQTSVFITLPAKVNPTFVIVSTAVEFIKRVDFYIEKRNSWLPVMNKPFGFKTLLSGSSAFDREFSLFAKDEVEILKVVSPEVREALLATRTQRPSLYFQGHTLTLRSDHSAHTAQEIDQLINIHMVLVRQLKNSGFIQ